MRIINKCFILIIFAALFFIILTYLIENALFSFYKTKENLIIPQPLDFYNIQQQDKHAKIDLTKQLDNYSVFKDKSILIPDERIHVFYYPWYRNIQYDGKFVHWNHRYLSNWNKKEAEKWPKGQHHPPLDIGSNFYPELGPYSSIDPEIINKHMSYIKESGAGVLAVSWYPPNMSDDEGEDSDSIITSLLDAAHKFNLKVCLHIEPFKGRNADSILTYLKYSINKYANHSAYYRYAERRSKKLLPVFYMYDSYRVSDADWQSILLQDGEKTIRNTKYDGIFIGLLLKMPEINQLSQNGFDGFYTYFGSQQFTFGSTSSNWAQLRAEATKMGLIFVPSVSPGYIDERVRPWNTANTKSRENGKYYELYWEAAVNNNADIVSITSFNEWHEGTQIEPAIPFSSTDFKYNDYVPNKSNYYIQLTRKWTLKFKLRRNRILEKN